MVEHEHWLDTLEKRKNHLRRSRNRQTWTKVIRQSTEARQQLESFIAGVPKRYRPILEKYSSVLQDELPVKYPRTRDIKHEIDTKDAKPINLPYYPFRRNTVTNKNAKSNSS
ncbi:hypothetical protein LTR93_011795 [Exophiala xenobiotica]|nr:hypothetical protein LTR93_011795 [Exophiala xenobiotica]